MPFLETERLQIVPFTEALIEAAINGVAGASGEDWRSAFAARLGAQVDADWPGPDLADALPFFLAQERADPGWNSLILHEDQLVGDIGFKGGPDEGGTVEVGYSLVPGARGRGLATEAVRALTVWALQQPGVQRVTAETEPENQPSMRVLERVGFQRAGEREGLILWVYAHR